MKITSRWDRYLGMTAAMTQVPVPVTTNAAICRFQVSKFQNENRIGNMGGLIINIIIL